MKIKVVCMFVCLLVVGVSVAIAQISSDPPQHQITVPIGLLEDGQDTDPHDEYEIRPDDSIIDLEHNLLFGTQAEFSEEDLLSIPVEDRPFESQERILKVFDISTLSTPQLAFEVEGNVIVGYVYPHLLYYKSLPHQILGILDVSNNTTITVTSNVALPPSNTGGSEQSLQTDLLEIIDIEQTHGYIPYISRVFVYDMGQLANGTLSLVNEFDPPYLYDDEFNRIRSIETTNELLVLNVSTSFPYYHSNGTDAAWTEPILGTQLYIYDIASEPSNPTLLSIVELPNLDWCRELEESEIRDEMYWVNNLRDLRFSESGQQLELSIRSDLYSNDSPRLCSAREDYLIDVTDEVNPTFTAHAPFPEHPSDSYFVEQRENGTYIVQAVDATGVIYLPLLSQASE